MIIFFYYQINEKSSKVMEKNYYSFVEKRTINEIIKTDKNINSDLSNIDIINDEEFINLIKHFLSYIYASNLTVIRTGLCYLKMICEKEKDRFEKSIYLLVQSGYISILNDEEFDMTSELLIFCDVNIYKNFLI